jgi:hypothetical protein
LLLGFWLSPKQSRAAVCRAVEGCLWGARGGVKSCEMTDGKNMSIKTI